MPHRAGRAGLRPCSSGPPAFADLPSPAEAGFAKAGAKPRRLRFGEGRRSGRFGLRHGLQRATVAAGFAQAGGIAAHAREAAVDREDVAHLESLTSAA